MNYTEQYDRYRKLLETALADCIPERDCPERNVENAMRYSLLGGGKRLRGVLVLACCELFGGGATAALPFACAIEMVHAYSLIHDDLPCMDNDTLRRGKPTCHVAFGEAIALLAGDALLTHAFAQICTAELTARQRIAATELLAKAAGTHGMIGGQVIDIEQEGKKIPEPLLNRLHSQKTGALIRAAAALGCVAAGAGEAETAAADRYAANLGLLFQITDDLLDVTATTEQLGKPVGSDAQNHKTTYATLYGAEQSRKIVAQLVQAGQNELAAIPGDCSFLTELIAASAARTY